MSSSGKDTSGRADKEWAGDEGDAPHGTESGPDEQPNFTERHPEHFRNPPGHVRELREEDSSPVPD